MLLLLFVALALLAVVLILECHKNGALKSELGNKSFHIGLLAERLKSEERQLAEAQAANCNLSLRNLELRRQCDEHAMQADNHEAAHRHALNDSFKLLCSYWKLRVENARLRAEVNRLTPKRDDHGRFIQKTES